MLSLDVAFIDCSWNYIVNNLGVIHCKEGTSGEQVAAALRPTLDRHKLKERVYAYVKDQGSNLKTTTTALSNSLEVSMNGAEQALCRYVCSQLTSIFVCVHLSLKSS